VWEIDHLVDTLLDRRRRDRAASIAAILWATARDPAADIRAECAKLARDLEAVALEASV
jgi:hypothetical protein